MSKQERFTPMLEANTERFTGSIALPFGVEEEIGLNIGHIRTLSQIGGIRHVRLSKDDGFEVSSTSNFVVGIGKDGSGISGMGVTSNVPTYDTEQNPIGRQNFIFKNGNWIDLDIKINSEEIKQRMLNDDQDVRNAEIWAAELNEALTRGIVSAGMKNLLTNLSLVQVAYSALVHSEIVTNALAGDFMGAARSLAIDAGTFNLMGPLLSRFESLERGEGYRISAFVNIELDRAVILGIASTLQQLASTIE